MFLSCAQRYLIHEFSGQLFEAIEVALESVLRVRRGIDERNACADGALSIVGLLPDSVRLNVARADAHGSTMCKSVMVSLAGGSTMLRKAPPRLTLMR